MREVIPELKVVNAVSKGVVADEWKAPLHGLFEKISAQSFAKAINYLPENMDLAGHLSFDLLVDSNNRILSFAGVYNGGRYPEGVYRVLNRTWVSEALRVQHGAFPYLSSRLILPVQLQALAGQLKLIFVSRESLRGRLFLQKWKQNQPDSELWNVSDKLVQVVPGVKNQSCFQFICTRNLVPVNWNPEQITTEEWSKL